MSKGHNIFNDITKLANFTLATTANIKNELAKFIKSQIESFIKSMNFVERQEFEVLKKMVIQNTLALEKLTGIKNNNVGSASNNIKKHATKNNFSQTNVDKKDAGSAKVGKI